MDIEKLVMLVKDRSEIYDYKHPNHRNFDHLAGVWRTIAQELHATDKEARSKWQNLRSNYMRERRKIRRLPRDVNLKNVLTWPYYNMLSFLGSVIRQKKGGNDSDIDSSMYMEEESQHFRDGTGEDEFETKYSFRNSDDLNDANATDEGNGKTANSESSILRKRKRANSLGEDNTHKLYLKHLEKLAAREEEDNDPDLMFLRSLLPSIKRLGPLENLEFRGEVIHLLKQKLTPPTPVVCYSNPSSVGSNYEQTPNNESSCNLISQ